MKPGGRVWTACLLLLIASACEDHERDRMWGRADRRLEGRWAIVSLYGAPVAGRDGPAIVNIGGGVIAWDLCNADRRPYRTDGNQLQLRPGGPITTIGCPDARDEELERALAPGLHAFQTRDGQLLIGDGALILRRTARPACPPRRYGESLKPCP